MATTIAEEARITYLNRKRCPQDFRFGVVLGEGSFSTVFLAREEENGRELAIKVIEKDQIIREQKQKYVMREKNVLQRIGYKHPFFIKLYYTFKDSSRFYFCLSYAPHGELVHYIRKNGCFDDACTQFYSAEIVSALEYLHSVFIIHRDLKPENILLSKDMHIRVTDFGSAKIVDLEDAEGLVADTRERRNSFVGTAQYVSPELLDGMKSYYSSDLWALGCIIFQFVSGNLPFWGAGDYPIFQKIKKLEYEFPDGFPATTRDVVRKLLVIDPENRIGCEHTGGYEVLKSHEFFKGVDFNNLSNSKAPELVPYLPAKGSDSENLWSQLQPGMDDHRMTRLIGADLLSNRVEDRKTLLTEDELSRSLQIQIQENDYHRFVENNCILKQGLVDKRKGLFARRRMFLLTEGPHLYYVDPSAMVLKGQIPWSSDLRVEVKNFKIFFVHTPNRTYYLEDPEGKALKWAEKINEVLTFYYPKSSSS